MNIVQGTRDRMSIARAKTMQMGVGVGVGGAVNWWEAGGATGCVAAYQAKGAASYAASLVNLANPGTYNLASGVAPDFNSASGWTFDTSRYLIETDLPAIINNFTVIGYGIPDVIGMSSSVICSSRSSVNSGWQLRANEYDTTNKVGVTFGGVVNAPSSINSPTIASIIALTVSAPNNIIYVGALTDTINATGNAPDTNGMIVGGASSGALSTSYNGTLWGLAFYNGILSAVEIAAVGAEMAEF